MKRQLGNAWRKWRRVAEKAANAQAWLFLTIFYVLVLSPFGLAIRLMSDPLLTKKKRPSYWLPRSAKETTVVEGRRQF